MKQCSFKFNTWPHFVVRCNVQHDYWDYNLWTWHMAMHKAFYSLYTRSHVYACKYWLLLRLVAVTVCATKALNFIILLFFFVLQKLFVFLRIIVYFFFIYLLTKAHSHNTQANFYYCLSYCCVLVVVVGVVISLNQYILCIRFLYI